MKLIVAVVPARLARRVSERLVADGLGSTQLSGRGGWLGERNATFLISLADGQVDEVLASLAEICAPRTDTVQLGSAELRVYANPAADVATVESGGMHAFVLAVEQVVHL